MNADFIRFVCPGLPVSKEKELARAILATVKHLAGQHDQMSHGRRAAGIKTSGDFHPETQKVILNEVSSVSSEFGVGVSEIASVKGEIEYTMEYDWENQTIKIPEFLAKFSPSVLDQYAEQSAKYSGGTSKNFKDMVRHEMGHAVRDNIRGNLLKKNREDLNNDFFDKLDNLIKNNPSPSRYGEKNKQEWISERFVIEMRGDAPKLLIPIFAEYAGY